MSHEGPVYRPSEPSPNDMRWAILRHDVPGEGWHLDLLLARPDSDGLATFRVAAPATAALLGATRPCVLPASRLPDHRRLYLDFEGELSGGRGTVSRLASGSLLWLDSQRPALRATLHPLGRLGASPRGPGREDWILTIDSLEPAGTSPNLGR